MIPSNRPVYGGDLNALRERLGATAGEMAFLMGVSMIKWTELVRKRQRMPVDMPTIEIMVRFLDDHLDAAGEMPALIKVTVTDIYERSRKLAGDISMKEFAISVGRQSSSGYRWITMGGNVSATMVRVLWLYLWNIERGQDKTQRLALRLGWDNMIRQIGRVNGIDDVFKQGYWNKGRARRERAQAIAA